MFYAAIEGLDIGDATALGDYIRSGYPLDGGLREMLADALAGEYSQRDHDVEPFRFKLVHRKGWSPLDRRTEQVQRDEDAAARAFVMVHRGKRYCEAIGEAAVAKGMSDKNVERAFTEFRRRVENDEYYRPWAYAAIIRAGRAIDPEGYRDWIELVVARGLNSE